MIGFGAYRGAVERWIDALRGGNLDAIRELANTGRAAEDGPATRLEFILSFLDWLEIPPGGPRKTIATTHLLVMLAATAVFAATWLAQLDGYKHDEVKTLAWILGVAAELLLTVGGYLGGSLVFVFGTRVLKREDASVIQAVVPGRIEGTTETPQGVER